MRRPAAARGLAPTTARPAAAAAAGRDGERVGARTLDSGHRCRRRAARLRARAAARRRAQSAAAESHRRARPPARTRTATATAAGASARAAAESGRMRRRGASASGASSVGGRQRGRPAGKVSPPGNSLRQRIAEQLQQQIERARARNPRRAPGPEAAEPQAGRGSAGRPRSAARARSEGPRSIYPAVEESFMPGVLQLACHDVASNALLPKPEKRAPRGRQTPDVTPRHSRGALVASIAARKRRKSCATRMIITRSLSPRCRRAGRLRHGRLGRAKLALLALADRRHAARHRHGPVHGVRAGQRGARRANPRSELLLKPGENATFAVDVGRRRRARVELHRRLALGERGSRLSRRDLARADLAPGGRRGPRARVLRAPRQPLRPNDQSPVRRPIRAPLASTAR